MTKASLFFFFLAFALHVPSHAHPTASHRIFTCTKQSAIRTLKIQYPNGTPLPCLVVYDKSQEGGDARILWQATTEEGFCEDKAEAFVNKLSSWGWSCGEKTAG
jgi:hypothetical protein